MMQGHHSPSFVLQGSAFVAQTPDLSWKEKNNLMFRVNPCLIHVQVDWMLLSSEYIELILQHDADEVIPCHPITTLR